MSDLVDPAFALSILPQLAAASLVTLWISLAAFALAVTLGLPLAIARRGRYRPLAAVVAGMVEFIRSTPPLVQLYLLFFGGPAIGIVLEPITAGIVALGVHYACYLSEVYRAGLDAVPEGQWEACRALGFESRWTYARIVLPQAIPPMLPMIGNYLISMFKDSALVAAVSVFELVTAAKLIGSDTFRYVEPMTIAGLLFLLMSLVAAWFFRRLERWARIA